MDEILISHYTFGTGGASIWNSWLYYWNENEWASICLDDLESDCKQVSTDFTDDGIVLLLDHGYKNGGDQHFDYEGVVFRLSSDKLQATERSKDIAMKHWPKEYMLQDEFDFVSQHAFAGEIADTIIPHVKPRISISR